MRPEDIIEGAMYTCADPRRCRSYVRVVEFILPERGRVSWYTPLPAQTKRGLHTIHGVCDLATFARWAVRRVMEAPEV